MTAVPCTLIRGGTSRGAYFLASDLPAEGAARNALLTRIMGGPDALQVDGIGGGHPLTSKVAVLRAGNDPDIDVSYLFLQVDPVKQTVSDAQNCGNILAGVGVYALEHGLVGFDSPVTMVRVRMENSGAVCHLDMPTPGGRLETAGDAAIDGVPGAAAPIVCNYLGIAGSSCGALQPTGCAVDHVEGLDVTCVDNGMPVVVMRAQDLGLSGTETPEWLDGNDPLKARLEALRLAIAPRMHLGNVASKSVPKLCLVSAPVNGGAVATRTFIPHVCHTSIGVLGAVSAATACLLPGSVAEGIAEVPDGETKVMDIEHPSGSLRVQLGLDAGGGVATAGVVRTARLLFRGEVYV
ncbi:MAG: 4-oxalomesaconate tautomerase [Rhodospirillaceae bacterium]|nr:4-oxalomesaconate tautomerase [Rhodospirillaceae bacterium]